MRILVVEDDPALSRSLELVLLRANMQAFSTACGEEVLPLAQLYDYDLIVLDLNLPDMSGFEVMHRLRQAKVQTPVLILTGEENMDAKVRGFRTGADDYQTKPFLREELVLRIQAIVRRSRGHAQSTIRIGRLRLNMDERSVEVNGSPVALSAKEYGILELLALRRDVTVTKEMILDHLYGGRDEPEIKIVDVFVCKLRKKLALALGHNSPLETIWGRGYVLRSPAPDQAQQKAHAVA